MTHLTRFCCLAAFSASLLCACIHPISREAREHVAPDISFAAVSENPMAFIDRQLLLAGAIISIDQTGESCTLELMEWQINRWGEPTYLDDNGRRFLVKSSRGLDLAEIKPGMLVTLAGVVAGQETRRLGEHEHLYPLFELTELHVWESPFRYGIHRQPGPGYPVHVGSDDDRPRHPYDPGYSIYPYTPYWYRNIGRQ